jgi:hypothetical protein
MNFESLAELIEPYAEGSFDELPKGLGELVASAFSPVAHWDNLTPNRRRNLASQHDSHNDPKNKSKNEYYLDLFDAIEGTKTEITNLELLNSSTPSDARIKKEDLAALHDRLGNLNRLQTLPPFLVKDWTTLTNDALANVVEMNIQLFDILKTPQPLNCIYAAIIRDLLPESDFESTFGVEPKTAELILWIWEAAQLVEWDAETLAEFAGAELFPDKKIMFKRIEAGLPKKFAPEVGFDWLKENYIPFGDFDKWYFENKPNHASTNQAEPKSFKDSNKSTVDWKVEAQVLAKQINQRQKLKDLYPSQIDVSDEIARSLRERGIFGADGKPLKGSYIKRHALKGISSAISKQLSTSNTRSK